MTKAQSRQTICVLYRLSSHVGPPVEHAARDRILGLSLMAKEGPRLPELGPLAFWNGKDNTQ